MRRVHLFEFEDLSWFPSRVRNYMTDFLEFVTNLADFYEPLTPLMAKCLNQAPAEGRIVDIASGGGGGLKKISKRLKQEVPGLKITLTDLYPNVGAFEKMQSLDHDIFSFEETSISALDVPMHLRGLRTMFLSFHHFKPNECIKILNDAVQKGMPILIVEAQKRDIEHLAKNLFSPVFVWLLTPFIRPFDILRIAITNLIPIVPIFVLWDGLVSVLRTYSEPELLSMAASADGKKKYLWEAKTLVHKGSKIIYLFGTPKRTP